MKGCGVTCRWMRGHWGRDDCCVTTL